MSTTINKSPIDQAEVMVNEPNPKKKQIKQIEYIFGKTKSLNLRNKPQKNYEGRTKFNLTATTTPNSYH